EPVNGNAGRSRDVPVVAGDFEPAGDELQLELPLVDVWLQRKADPHGSIGADHHVDWTGDSGSAFAGDVCLIDSQHDVAQSKLHIQAVLAVGLHNRTLDRAVVTDAREPHVEVVAFGHRSFENVGNAAAEHVAGNNARDRIG